jgi:hypothetical protein
MPTMLMTAGDLAAVYRGELLEMLTLLQELETLARVPLDKQQWRGIHREVLRSASQPVSKKIVILLSAAVLGAQRFARMSELVALETEGGAVMPEAEDLIGIGGLLLETLANRTRQLHELMHLGGTTKTLIRAN